MVVASTRFLPEAYRWVLRGELPEAVDEEKKGKPGRPKKVRNGVVRKERKAKAFIVDESEFIEFV